MQNPSFNPELKRVIESPIQGGRTEAEQEAARAAAEAQARAAAETARLQGGNVIAPPSSSSANYRRGMPRGAKIAMAVAVPVLAVGAVAGGVAASGVLNHSDDTAQGNGDNNGQNGNGNGGIENGKITIEVSPESLASLSAEQIEQKLSIPAVDASGNPTKPEAYAKTFVNNYEGFLNSGTTKAQFKPYDGKTPEAYSSAMQATYDDPSIKALFDGSDGMGGARQAHEVVLDLARDGYISDAGQYVQGFNLASEPVVTEPQTSAEDDFTVEIVVNYTSNAKELGLDDLLAGTAHDISGNERTEKYSLHVTNVGGELKSSMTLLSE